MDRTERLGLGISTAGHVLLFGALSLGLLRTSVELPPKAPTIEVTFADAVALESRVPNPVDNPPEAAQAPELGEMQPDAAPPEPVMSKPIAEPEPAPPVATPPKPKPAPVPRAKPEPKPTPAQPPRAKPEQKPTPKPAQQTAATPRAKPTPNAKPAPQRASRLGSDFLKGLESDAPTPRKPAAVAGSNAPMGAVAARALNAEITRQIKPYWRPPSGADAERLVTLLSVTLARDGSVGQVEVIGQEGITPSNRAQAELHAERAVQAVRRASPFQNLPPEYYEQWKWLQPLRIYASLGQ